MSAGARHTRQRGRIERQFLASGRTVAGIDEVGRGCIAGPVVAACVVPDFERIARLRSPVRRLLRDSKLLSAKQRRELIPIIREISLDYQVASASVSEIEQLGIQPASYLAMRRALTACRVPFDVLLVDGKWKIAGYDGEQHPIVKGDNLCYSIAAASILAKESRDDFMRRSALKFPVYGFAEHVGYGTKQHLDMIRQHGICSLHRRNFDPVRRIYAAQGNSRVAASSL